MPSSSATTTITTAILTVAIIAVFAILGVINSPSRKWRRQQKRLRRQLPNDLGTWRMPGNCQAADEKIWIDLTEIFHRAGFTLWRHAFCTALKTPGNTLPMSSGFGYATTNRPTPNQQGPMGTVAGLGRFDYHNPLCRAARTAEGHEVIIRVIVIGNAGHEHLKILRKVATGENSLFSSNHTLPMFREFQFDDIVFGIFPKVGAAVADAYHPYWPKNSVGDIINMLMQMLEALAFIHGLNIAHRDAFRDNFVVQWHPESLLMMQISPSHPRVYLIDFEVAVEFSPDIPREERLSIGYPTGGSFTDAAGYARPYPPEMASGKCYDPFKLDVWQLGSSLSDFKSTIASIDKVLLDMIDSDAVRRLDAKSALDRLSKVVHSMPPESLLLAPVVVRGDV